MSDYRDDYRDRDRRDSRDGGSRDRGRDERDGGGSSYESRAPLPSKSMMGSRIYVGKLPSDIRDRDIEKVFGKYGRLKEVAMKGNYCFIVRRS